MITFNTIVITFIGTKHFSDYIQHFCDYILDTKHILST